MYIVTFYSYKGGVGRSMALANTAALLAKAGKRVLLVDFDLEAPGLPSYGPFGNASGLPGVVDYVEQYRRDLKAPDAAKLIVECELAAGQPIWIMPAGDNRSPLYTERLGGIDWKELYDREQGFLMFEDLRQQWERHPARFDYVLIDSRTGHTDVGGICTRQLPDAVVVMFVPTRQNIEGLEPVVADIRKARRPDGTPIRLHFCASNVPDEYDEDGVLEERMKSAREKLGYGRPAVIEPMSVTIHHRTSLEILGQGLIVVDRANSKLAKEYGGLRTSIVAENLRDVEGATFTLNRLPKIYDRARSLQDGRLFNEIADRAREISRLHPEDGAIAIAAAQVFSLVGEYDSELASFGKAIEKGHRTNFARLLRAGTLLKAGRDDEALQDLHAILASPDGTIFEFVPAASLLATTSENPALVATELLLRTETRPRAKVALAHELLMSDYENMAIVAKEMKRILDSAEMSDDLAGDVRNVAQLAFIATRDYDALRRLNPDPTNVPDLFNHAMAHWGATGEVPTEWFERILSMPRGRDEDANALQCYGLIKAGLGDSKGAAAEFDSAIERVVPTERVFSCWTYFYGSGEELTKDLKDMKRRLRGGKSLRPPFMEGTEA